nr:MAG TPA: hypothetical protein [Caudoviricetes sp.]
MNGARIKVNSWPFSLARTIRRCRIVPLSLCARCAYLFAFIY